VPELLNLADVVSDSASAKLSAIRKNIEGMSRTGVRDLSALDAAFGKFGARGVLR
jgi:hypothetical protein